MKSGGYRVKKLAGNGGGKIILKNIVNRKKVIYWHDIDDD